MAQEKLKKRQLLRSLFKSNAFPSDDSLPILTAKSFVLLPDTGELSRFNKLTGWQDTEHLAPTWLQMRALPTYLNLITSPQFPFSPLGLVHLNNDIKLKQALPTNAIYKIDCAINQYTKHPKGMAVKASVTASLEGLVVYEAQASFLALIKSTSKNAESKAPTKHPTICHESVSHWQLATDIGRCYAAISGDYNLIHINPVTAKLFGFKRHIAHGMYVQARAMSDLFALNHEHKFSFPLKISTAFKKPVFLPADIQLGFSPVKEGLKFDVYQGEVLHATGKLLQGED